MDWVDNPKGDMGTHTVCQAKGQNVTYRVVVRANIMGDDKFATQTMGSIAGLWITSKESNTLAEAKSEAEDIEQSKLDIQTLNRLDISTSTSTPWGKAQGAVRYATGVTFYSASGHGGFILSEGRNNSMPGHLRHQSRAYEEDRDWSKVALAFPELFSARERRLADDMVRNSMPEVWEHHHGVALKPGESREKDRRNFVSANWDNWVVTSASLNDDLKTVTVTAKLGGRDRLDTEEEREFEVDRADYNANRKFGFIIDLTRHREVHAPFSGPGMR